MQDLNQSQIEKLQNEMISRHDDDTVPWGPVGRIKKVRTLVLASRCGHNELRSSSALLVAHVPEGTQRSSRLESNLISLCSTGFSLNPTLL